MSNHFHGFDNYSAPLLADMPRWTDIVYPALPSEPPGTGVVSVPTYKILRWAAEGWPSATGAYLADLADRLADCGPPLRRPALSTRPDEIDWRIYISYPADFPAPLTAAGDRSRELCMPAGLVLSYAADDIEYDNPSEAARLRLVMERHYPDGDIELEFILADGQTGWISNFRRTVLSLDHVEALETAIGSARLDHYGEGSVYSSDVEAHPYAVHPLYDKGCTGEPPGACYLVSNAHVLEAAMFFDGEAD